MSSTFRYGKLAICEMEYCDFVCWTPHGMHIECILPDTLFETIKPTTDTFFKKVLLPLLITGRTQREQTQSTQGTSHASEKDDTYCWCKVAMAACDNACTLSTPVVSFCMWVYSANHVGNDSILLCCMQACRDIKFSCIVH